MRTRTAVIIALAAFLVYAVWLWHTRFLHTLFDYQGFYCASRVMLARANPYLYGPLHQCEAAISPMMGLRLGPLTVPGPLPPYALALLFPIAALPWSVSAPLWFCVLLACIAGTAAVITRLSALPFPLALSVIAFAESDSLSLGSLAPLPIFLIVFGALALSKRWWTVGAVSLACATLAPHIVIGVIIAALLFAPRTRLPMLVAAVVLCTLNFVVADAGISIAYVNKVLPAHALVEVSNIGQLSLTHLLNLAGVPARTALEAGSLQFAAFLVCGIVLASRLRLSHGVEMLVLVPAGFAVVGGSYLHYSEVALAIPLAACLGKLTGSNVAKAALVLLAVPWQNAFGIPNLPIASAIVFLLTAHLWEEVRGLALVSGTAALSTLAVLGARTTALDGPAVLAAHNAQRALPLPSPTSIPESSAGLFVNMPLPHPWLFALPLFVTDLGLLMMCWAVVHAAISLPVVGRTLATVGDS